LILNKIPSRKGWRDSDDVCINSPLEQNARSKHREGVDAERTVFVALRRQQRTNFNNNINPKNMILQNNKLNSFSAEERLTELKKIVNSQPDFPTAGENVNMHLHSFFSFNAENFSPTRIALEAKIHGFYAAGIIDFDVLDGKNEFLDAGELLGLRTNVGVETRIFNPDFSDEEINSPGEPGVGYVGGSGFAKDFPEGSVQSTKLAEYRENSAKRNLALIKRINPNVSDIAIDYEKNVLPLAPSGNATERHIIKAYINLSIEKFSDPEKLKTFWSDILEISKKESESLISDIPKMENVVRAKFAKKGGFGYVQPSIDTFPLIDDFFSFVKSCAAIPMESWLDGTSGGESNPQKFLEVSVVRGAESLNIIPDRNWNIADEKIKAIKVANLREIVKTAVAMNLPLNIGTEMNKKGQPIVDDLQGEILKEFKKEFLTGAKIMVGHTILTRFADFDYCGEKASAQFNDKNDKNNFFELVGALPPLTLEIADKLRKLNVESAFNLIADSAKQMKWS
jgi:hypothetical protein